MTEPSKDPEGGKREAKVGGAQGGADSAGSGNILAGVQPDTKDDDRERKDV